MKKTDSTLHVVIYRTGGIGDVILSSVALAQLYQLEQPVKIYWISYSPKLEMISHAYPQITPIAIAQDAGYKENLRRILSVVEKADVFIDLQRSARSMILCRIAALKYGAGYFTWQKGSVRRTMMVLRSYWSGRKNFRPALLINTKPRYQLMEDCVIRAVSSIMPFNKKGFPEIPVHHLSSGHLLTSDVSQWIAVCAGALHHGKWAPAEQFIDILNNVQKKNNAPLGVVFLGDDKDNDHSNTIVSGLQHFGKIINHCGKSSLTESAAILSQCTVVLSNDSALGHLAESVHVDVAMLFGPTVEAFGFVPFRKGSQAFSAAVGCRPCTKSGYTDCRYGDKLCFMAIDNSQVANFLIQKLKRPVLAQA
jgi:ADP-heptose:LPS heptosyltransferase